VAGKRVVFGCAALMSQPIKRRETGRHVAGRRTRKEIEMASLPKRHDDVRSSVANFR
jgi:hypothetical protein